MSEDNETSLEELKETADSLGIDYHPAIGVAKLQAKIDANEEEAVVVKPVKQTPAQARKNKKDEQTALVRIRVTCMNPMKSAWKGELVTCGNQLTGSLTKYVPYNVDWHVPRIMLEVLKDKKCQIFPEKTAGVVISGGKIIPEFAIEVLPPLTEKEIKELAQRQAMAAGTAA